MRRNGCRCLSTVLALTGGIGGRGAAFPGVLHAVVVVDLPTYIGRYDLFIDCFAEQLNALSIAR